MKVHVGRSIKNNFYFWEEGSKKEYCLEENNILSCVDDNVTFKNKSEYIKDLENTEATYIGCIVIDELTVENIAKAMPEIFL